MKNLLILLLVFIFCKNVCAQNEKTAQTQSNHIIDAGFVSATYTYEHAFAKKYTISGSAGIVGTIGYRSVDYFGGSNYWYYSMHPCVIIETRYYYNLEKRVRKGKNTDGNTGSFLSVQCGYVFKPIKKHNVYDDVCGFSIAPYWGLRRIWWNHLLFEFRAGFAFGKNNYNYSDVSITLGLRLGYKF
ncbi:MAG: hypothetical protein LBJ63_09130 [Prevotellaceae bacterium]|jgi:hypothetical protein|nr:hypothetical protein [Prevotellaceae bacterium]